MRKKTKKITTKRKTKSRITPKIHRKIAKPILSPVQSYHRHIVEFSYNSKQSKLVIRFLDGSSYVVSVENLPKRLLTKKPKWEESVLGPDKMNILVQAGSETRFLPAHIIQSRGKII